MKLKDVSNKSTDCITNVIYLDPDQCKYFDVPYWDVDDKFHTFLSVLSILDSKEYDKETKDLLDAKGNTYIELSRSKDMMPGWFQV